MSTINPQRGKFIIVEGLEGAGKTTAIEYIQEYLVAKKINFIQTREPGGTELAEGLRDLLKKHYSQEIIYPETEVLLLYAARLQLVKNIILPALNNNTWVIGDRHDLSTIAYQCGGRGVDSKFVQELKKNVLNNFDFDLCIYLDIDPKIGLERARARADLDRIEQESIEFFTRARNKYLELARDNKRIKTIDASVNLEQMKDNIHAVLAAHYD